MSNPPSTPPFDEARAHRWFAVETNNLAWELVERPDRPAADTVRMLHAAHTACFHWAAVGTPLNHLRADVLLATAYTSANRIHEAVGYAEQALALLPTLADATAFDRATTFAAAAVALAPGQPQRSKQHRQAAVAASHELPADDRDVFDRLFPAVAGIDPDTPE